MKTPPRFTLRFLFVSAMMILVAVPDGAQAACGMRRAYRQMMLSQASYASPALQTGTTGAPIDPFTASLLLGLLPQVSRFLPGDRSGSTKFECDISNTSGTSESSQITESKRLLTEINSKLGIGNGTISVDPTRPIPPRPTNPPSFRPTGVN